MNSKTIKFYSQLFALLGFVLLHCVTFAKANSVKACYPTLGAYFVDGASYKDLWVCDNQYCGSQAKSDCEKPEIKKWRKRLQTKGPSSLNEVQVGTLATYLSLMNWTGPVNVQKDFRFQTGPYEFLSLGRKPSVCLPEILESARLLEEHFPKYTFSVDGRIRNCRNLMRGVHAMVLAKSKVRKNIDKFISPMHTVFFSTMSKFNNQELGEMGLYVNTNVDGEIQRRLIESSTYGNSHMGGRAGR